MKPRKLSAIAALLALTALVLAGCGGGGDETTESAPATTTEATPLSKDELIASGDGICAEVNAAVGAAGASEAETTEQTVQVANLYIGMVERIQDLGVPDDPAGYAEFSEAAEELAKVEGEAKLAAEREDSAALAEATTAAAPALEEFSSVAADYGFEQCSEGPSAPAETGSGSGVTPPAEEGGVEVVPEEPEAEAPIEEVVPEEEVAPETGGAGGGVEEAAPETGGGSSGGSSGGVGPG